MSSLGDQPPVLNVNSDTRSALQIVWSCLFIIFTCTWTAIHPNVPPPQVSSSKWKKLWWRIKIMLWTLMLPEMMVSWATCQWKDAREISAEATRKPTRPARPSKAADDQSSEMELALISNDASSHTGSPDDNENSPHPAEWTRTHSYFLLMGGFAIRNHETKNTWIPISFDDVKHPGTPWPEIEEADILNVTKGEALAKTIVVLQVIWFVSQLCGRVIQRLAITELEIMTLAYAIICAMLYTMWFSKPYDVQRPIFLESSSHPSAPHFTEVVPVDFLNGLWLWGIHRRIVSDSEFSADLDEINANNLALLISATLFGGIHLLAWNFEFPTQLELIMWRVASLCVSFIPLAFFLLLGVLVSVILLLEDTDGLLGALVTVFGTIHVFLVPVLHNAYLIARIILFIQSFVLLRSLSSSAMQAVSWSSFFPHI